jgi:plastocyanin
MKGNLPNPAPEAPTAGDVALAAWRRAGFRLSRRPTLADFRSHSFHLRQHRPGTRTRFSLLRDVAVLAALLALQPASGGTISGYVHAEGKSGTEAVSANSDAYGSRKYKFVQRVDYAAMRDFVVSIEGVTATNAAKTNILTVTTMKVAQQGATFSPHVLPVLAGTTVEWPNNDDIYHNVFSDSEAKQFDLDLYKGNPPDKRVTFDKPGKVDVFCSIHAEMHCIVLVMPNPYFAVTDNAGHYIITNVPPGTYKLKAWHERLPADVQEITMPADGGVKADFTLTIKNLPQL